MVDNPLNAVMSRIEAASVKTNMMNGPEEAEVIFHEEIRPTIIEAIAIKSLNLQFDTAPLFTEIAKALKDRGETPGRDIHASEFDKIIGDAVRKVREEQLLGSSIQSDRGR